MRTLYFLLPGTGGKFACGGLWAELKTLKMAQQICSAEVVTYRQREKDTLFLDDVLEQPHLENVIFVLSWGFDVPKLAARVRSHPTLYHAHSAGYGFQLPASVPIITVSRNTLGYWGQQAPNNLLYYLPNEISDGFQNLNQERDIDVLVQARKSSRYLLNHLIPALKQVCNVYVVDHYIEDLPSLFNRAKVYLYDSAEYWALQGVSEGFGLQPLEAFACGCQVFSSLNGGLSDYLDPGFNCQKIAGYSLEFDTQRILRTIENFRPSEASESFLAEYRIPNILQRLDVILQDVNQFFDHQQHHSSNLPSFTKTRLFKLSLETMWQKIQKRYLRFR